jgi:predicted site-specific integrase-resolvase
MRNLKEAARVMGIKHRSLYVRIERGRLPEATKVGGRWMVPEKILAPYVQTLTVRGATKYANEHQRPISKQSMYNYIHQGRIPAVKDHLGIYRIRRADIDAFFDIRKG